MSDNFKSIIRDLPPVFDTEDGHKIGKQFNSPCIEGSTLYQRQTGDLTSNFLKILTEDCVKDLLKTEKNICRIQYITHMTLDESDKIALETYLINKSKLDEYLETLMERSIEKYLNMSDPIIDRQSRLDIFATLVAKKTIIIKFAFPKNPRSIFHKKTGIFHFKWGDKISFVGGNNDTAGGLENNIETLETRRSWIGESDMQIIKKREEDFEKAWNNKSSNFITCPLSLKNLNKLIIRSEKKFNKKFSENKEKEKPKIENLNEKWSFQNDAVSIFLEKKSGILEMATGTGKTITTFKIIDKLIEAKKVNKIIIQMKGTELIDQWEKELNKWKINKEEIIRVLKHNEDKKDLDTFLTNFEYGESTIDIIFISQFFLPEILNELKDKDLSRSIIIHDEVHNLPTQNVISKIEGLHKNFAYKLGLSATVEDPYDNEKNECLYNEVGPIIFQFGLDKAIKRGILVEFDVDFITYELTPEEKKEKTGWILWKDKQIKQKQMGISQIEEIFRREVSKINKKAQNKINLLDNYLKDKINLLDKCFIFALEMEYGNQIFDKLIKYTPEIKTHYDEHADKKNLEDFASGNLKCIINCKKLNEGINMKSLSNIILVSSESKRQLIQRLGRVLRIDEENNPNKRAFVLDFIEDRQDESKTGPDYERQKCLIEWSKLKREH